LPPIAGIIGLTQPLFDLFGNPVSWRDVVLIAGGLFLLYKGTREIHHALENDGLYGEEPANARLSFAGVVTQIMLLDVVFSLDSVITAVGMATRGPHYSTKVCSARFALGGFLKKKTSGSARSVKIISSLKSSM
jgi:predicted tellurium resistance membrane protein TerC